MDKKALETYHNKLIILKERLSNLYQNIAKEHLKEQMREQTGDLSGYSLHMADAGTDNFEKEFALNVAGRETQVLYQIDRALEKIENKSFGSCEMCEGSISANRLDAIPYAARCIKCESEIENEQP